MIHGRYLWLTVYISCAGVHYCCTLYSPAYKYWSAVGACPSAFWPKSTTLFFIQLGPFLQVEFDQKYDNVGTIFCVCLNLGLMQNCITLEQPILGEK